MKQRTRTSRAVPRQTRRGVITIVAALLSIALFGIVAFTVDVGYVLSVKEEMQRTADAAALAACWDYSKQIADGEDPQDAEASARAVAAEYASGNVISQAPPEIDANYSNSPSGDLVFGYVQDVYGASPQLDTTSSGLYNAVRVKVRRDETLNGQAPLFFAKVFGFVGQSLDSTATAAIVRDVRGFQTPAGDSKVELLPFTLDWHTWHNWQVHCEGDDDWTWDVDNEVVCAGSDGWLEVSLYPQGTGSPGNRGTVDIGGSNNSTSDIARQILHGVSKDDLAHHGGALEFDECGKLYLNGDTGISAGVKDELDAIKGDPRIIPIFYEVNGPGNNAEYTIVKWMGVRVMDVKLTGPMNKKHVTIQAAPCVTPGVLPATTTGSSSYVYSPAVLLE